MILDVVGCSSRPTGCNVTNFVVVTYADALRPEREANVEATQIILCKERLPLFS